MQISANITFPSNATPPSPVDQTPKPKGKLYRVLHDYEIWLRKFTPAGWAPGDGQFYHPGGWGWRNGMPEVYWVKNSHAVPFTKEWQLITYGLNPGMTGKKFRVFCDDHRAFHNRLGFWTDDTIHAEYRPCKDWVNKIDLDAVDPAWDKIRVCGGATISGIEDGDEVILETLDFYNPPLKPDGTPDVEWVKARPWLYFTAVNIHMTPNGEGVSDFPQRNGLPCYMPIVARSQVRFWKGALQEVTEIANPYKIYL